LIEEALGLAAQCFFFASGSRILARGGTAEPALTRDVEFGWEGITPEDESMRPTLLLAATATLAFASFAPSTYATDTSAAARNAAPQLSQTTASDQMTSRRRHRQHTGAGSKVSMPNNAKSTGTQAQDAQQGGSGKAGAR
jgi:hypothetical protein